MLVLKLFVFAIAISSGALGRATDRGNIRHKQSAEEYKYNHPPAPENYEPIPVAVVYEDQGNREDKSIKNDVPSRNNVKEVSKETPKSEPPITKQPTGTEEANDEHIDTKTSTIKQEEPKPTTYRPQKETYQIPVAVVYEPDTINNQKSSRNDNRGKNNSIKIQQPALEEKQTTDEDNYSTSAPVNGHVGTDTSAYNRPELNRRQKIPKPTPEKQTSVVDNISQVSQTTSQVSQTTPTSDKPEELYIRQRTQKPATKEIQMTNESPTPSFSTEKQPQNLVKTENSKRPISEQKQTTFKDNTSISDQEYRNSPSIPKPERSETIKVTEDTRQYTKRGNSTRVREVIPIIQSENVVFSHSGNFKYSYEGGDGTKAFEEGELKTFDDETAGEAVSGGFSYTAKDGKEYSLSYTADENGYRPVGAHLPTPPPIPPAIARALAYLATKTTPEPVTEPIVKS